MVVVNLSDVLVVVCVELSTLVAMLDDVVLVDDNAGLKTVASPPKTLTVDVPEVCDELWTPI